MENKNRTPIDRLLFATFLKGRISSRDLWNEKGKITPEDNRKIADETSEIVNDDSTYLSSAIYPTCLQNPSRPMRQLKSCITASTRLRLH